MKVTFLGTNGFYPTELGETVCVLIETHNFNLILDAGSGLQKYDRFEYKNKPTYIFLSHLHLDHISGLFTLPKFKFEKPLKVLVSEESREELIKITRFPYMCPFDLMSFKTEIISLQDSQKHNLPFEFIFLPVIHSVHTVGYRFWIDGKVISYVTDTGICDNAVKLAMNADLLVCECSHLSNEANKGWPHINPQEAADLAVMSNVKKLVINHFDSNRYKTLQQREEARDIVIAVFPNVILGKDMLSLET